ncbi:unnamed protein product [Scytosiphon promiscuus]
MAPETVSQKALIFVPLIKAGSISFQVELRFQNIHYSLGVSKTKAFLMGGKPGVKHILKNVSGAVASGQILAIIGSSGAGKTSLLNVLVGKTSGDTKGVDITGDVTVNGKALSKAFFLDNAAYVPQEDHLWSALTVRESLMYACTMYSPSMSGAECSKRVDEALASLGLEACQHTKVGSVFIKGISGGQKRRTSIGLELVVQRKILFLDEPTSGLDATSASEIMALLRRLASETGVIIITSVHQPSSRVFENFDQVILLTMGRTAYFGPAVDGLEHFRRLGHEPTGLVNPAEYLLEITNSDFSDAADVKRLTELWSESPACEALNKRLQAPFLPPVTSGRNTGCMDSVRRLGQLVSRASLSSIRDPAAYALRLVLYVGMSLFLGNVYSRLENTQEDVLERAFFILWINAFNPYMDLAALPLFGQEKSVVMKEVQILSVRHGNLSHAVRHGEPGPAGWRCIREHDSWNRCFRHLAVDLLPFQRVLHRSRPPASILAWALLDLSPQVFVGNVGKDRLRRPDLLGNGHLLCLLRRDRGPGT